MEETLSVHPSEVQAASLTGLQLLGALAVEHDVPVFEELPLGLQPACALLIRHGADYETVRQECGLESVEEVEAVEAELAARLFRRLFRVAYASPELITALQPWATPEIPLMADDYTVAQAPKKAKEIVTERLRYETSPNGNHPTIDAPNKSNHPPKPSTNNEPATPGQKLMRTTIEGRAIMDIHNLLKRHGIEGADLFSPRAAGLAEVYRPLMHTDESEASIQKRLGLSPSAYAQRKKLIIKALVNAKPSLLTVPVLPEQEASAQVIKPREKWAPGERLKVLRLLRVVADDRGVNIGKLVRDDVYQRFLKITNPSISEEEVYGMLGGDKPTTTLARNLLNLLDQRLDPKDISIPELRKGIVDSSDVANKEKILEVRDRLLSCDSDWQEMLEISQELSRLLSHALGAQPTANKKAEPPPVTTTDTTPSAAEELLTIISKKHPNPDDLHQQLRLIAGRIGVGPQTIRRLLAGRSHPPADKYLPVLFAHFKISQQKQEHLLRLYEQERGQSKLDRRKR